ncbi:SDR family NAD(P)-dependent oxidoreductase [Glacieibacterium megasporae]|uniref:SDR family NAD(P)-dependent oxidoreductase n=1 Tax=Glacieibacterium megasporae TaxID=2835787 RepID=UPI001C1E8092|nr:SDR family NAD(P)-dependent oxidoreductase [Polymorphobacter megasporae]UAJ10758.1 SDR family NAD(P)-dependent oxidoreductase [Polymorphobacter megasporae]
MAASSSTDFNGDTGRVVVVTGAGKGLGAAFARGWAARGARVVVNNRHHGNRASSAKTLAAALRADGGDAVADLHAVDAPGAAAVIVAAALAAFGRIDALILNAGITGPAAKIPALPADALAEVMAINFFANTALIDAALPHIAASPSGRILFVSSTGGLYGVRGRSAYAASKGAITAYALSLAHEQRRAGIGVNVLCPYAATAMTAAPGVTVDPRLAPDKAAAAAVWLTSSACTATGEIWVTGGNLVRRALAIEGAMADAATPEALAAAPPPPPAPGFDGGEAAFTDFYSHLTKEA